ncbi:BA75_01478T0 [Komagataella pastoris]|uniref:BA75_01478T0 n=1 Tax=Komagataella pastoris TaxID=4922 RepID=A0A1B2J545_PICPA|nr:BA75_01478T0 [Komagataella pastoris]
MDRRPNPPGWVPPKAPYNPYDPNDIRPPEGYPSEFLPPGKQKSFSEIPKDATEYEQIRHSMNQLKYTPRPPSELYPGQNKVLKRINTKARFQNGLKITSRLLMFGVSVYGVFFYRWNEGYDNVFSPFYRFRLKCKKFISGELSDKEEFDLSGNSKPLPFKVIREETVPEDIAAVESAAGLQRPTQKHLMEVERILQEREEKMLRAVDIAEETLKKQGTVKETKPFWKIW